MGIVAESGRTAGKSVNVDEEFYFLEYRISRSAGASGASDEQASFALRCQVSHTLSQGQGERPRASEHRQVPPYPIDLARNGADEEVAPVLSDLKHIAADHVFIYSPLASAVEPQGFHPGGRVDFLSAEDHHSCDRRIPAYTDSSGFSRWIRSPPSACSTGQHCAYFSWF